MTPLLPHRITTIPVWPSTNVRSTQGDRWLFAVSDEYLEEFDLRKLEENGKKGGNLRRKRQLEKYNAYKSEIFYWSQKLKFKLPNGYFGVWFYVPFPKSWTKKKCAKMAAAPHIDTPDLDNLIKALLDGLMPRRNRIAGDTGADDRRIHNYIPFKIWCPPGQEKIVIAEYSEKEITTIFPIPTKVEYSAARKPRGKNKTNN